MKYGDLASVLRNSRYKPATNNNNKVSPLYVNNVQEMETNLDDEDDDEEEELYLTDVRNINFCQKIFTQDNLIWIWIFDAWAITLNSNIISCCKKSPMSN